MAVKISMLTDQFNPGQGLAVEYSDDAPAPAVVPPADPAANAQVPEPEVAPAADASPAQNPEPGSGDGEPATPAAETAAKLYDYAGRKLTADQLHEEVTKNLLPDYTKKSQFIANKLGGKPGINNAPAAASTASDPQAPELEDWEKPGWIPKDYNEILDAADRRREKNEQRAQAEQTAVLTQAQTETDAQLAEVKKLDPNVDENSLFDHAEKFGFTDLVMAHANQKEMIRIANQTRDTTVRNVQKRNADPIAGRAGVVIDDADGYDPSAINPNESAVDVLRRTKSK